MVSSSLSYGFAFFESRSFSWSSIADDNTAALAVGVLFLPEDRIGATGGAGVGAGAGAAGVDAGAATVAVAAVASGAVASSAFALAIAAFFLFAASLFSQYPFLQT